MSKLCRAINGIERDDCQMWWPILVNVGLYHSQARFIIRLITNDLDERAWMPTLSYLESTFDLRINQDRCMVLESQQQVNHSHSVRTKHIACIQNI